MHLLTDGFCFLIVLLRLIDNERFVNLGSIGLKNQRTRRNGGISRFNTAPRGIYIFVIRKGQCEPFASYLDGFRILAMADCFRKVWLRYTHDQLVRL